MHEVQALIRALEEQRNAALNALAQAQAKIATLEVKIMEIQKSSEWQKSVDAIDKDAGT